MDLYVCMPELRLKKGRFNRELYVVSFASDLRGQSNHRPPAVGASNETLPDSGRDLQAAMKFFVVAASNVFHGIDKDQPPQLGGDGIVLYPPADPEGMFALHVSIVESDAGARNQGKLLDSLFSRKEVKSALDAIAEATGAAGAIPATLLTRAMGALTTAIPLILQANKDDILLDYNFSGREMSRYHGTPEGRLHRFENRKAAAGIMVYAAPPT
jgi:hypothetical protein